MCLSPRDRSLRQFRKIWTTCHDYPVFSSGIELRLATAAADSVLRLDTSCSCSSPGDWIQVTTISSSCGWIQVTAESILRLTRFPAAWYGLRPTPYHGWLEFRQLDTSYSWLHPTADSSSGGWIRLKADSILRLDSSFGGSVRVAADSILRLTRVLYFNISSKFKDLFCKIHHFYGLFSTDWFQLPLIQALTAASRSLKKLEEAWRSLKKLEEASRP